MEKFKLEIDAIKELAKLDLSVPENKEKVFSLIKNRFGVVITQNERIEELENELNQLKGEKGRPKFSKRR